MPSVALFVTWLVELHRPNVVFAAIRLLEQAGGHLLPAPQGRSTFMSLYKAN